MSRESKKLKVFVGLSGGVDSSVAALILRNKGYEVTGVHLRCWNQGGCDEKEAEDARRVAASLGIPFYVFDMEEEYKRAVVDYMIREYKAGLTPNPDVMCNKEIKFGLFLKKALELGADYIATGHYVIKKGNKLYAARDKNKDQSYFLWTLTGSQLEHSLFPIGNFTKPYVRKLAAKAGLLTANKKDSQGICFLGQVTLEEFLSAYIPEKRGDIVNVSGEKIGEHHGVQFYTIGQRHGLAVPGKKPYYVVSKNAEANRITVIKEGENTIALSRSVFLRDVNFIDKRYSNRKTFKAKIRTRYRQHLHSGTIKNESGKIYVVFKRPQSFIASGQSAVFYAARGEMIGGGVII